MNIFNFQPSDNFQYIFYISFFIFLLVLWTFFYDFYTKKTQNKFLKKAMNWKIKHIKRTFPLIWAILILSRIEWIFFLSMKFLWIIWFIALFIYSFILFKKINKEYLWKLKNKKRFWT